MNSWIAAIGIEAVIEDRACAYDANGILQLDVIIVDRDLKPEKQWSAGPRMPTSTKVTVSAVSGFKAVFPLATAGIWL
jgi:hypothetical protein